MPMIGESVGERGANRDHDVRIVKYLLNRSGILDKSANDTGNVIINVPTLSPDGTVNDMLIETIRKYQKEVVKLHYPDGRIDPGKRTIKSLAEMLESKGAVVPIDHSHVKARVAMGGHSAHLRVTLNLQDDHPLTVKQNEIWRALDGNRLILSASSSEIVFLLLDNSGHGNDILKLNPYRGKVGQVYAQTRGGFSHELESVHFKDLHQKLLPTKIVTEVAAAFILGMVAGSSWTGFALVSGVSFVDVYEKNKGPINAVCDAVPAFIEAHKGLDKYAPTLNKKIGPTLFFIYWESVGPHLLSSLQATDIVKIVGAMVAKLTLKVVGTKLAVCITVQTNLTGLTSAILKRTPAAIQQALGQLTGDPLELVSKMRQLGIPVTHDEKTNISRELLTHPGEIKTILEKLGKELQKVAHAF